MKLRIGSVVVLLGVAFIIPKSCVVRKVVGRAVGADPGELVRKSGDWSGECGTPAGKAGVCGAQWIPVSAVGDAWIPAFAGMTIRQGRPLARTRRIVTSVP
jgi:hypothetical protein